MRILESGRDEREEMLDQITKLIRSRHDGSKAGRACKVHTQLSPAANRSGGGFLPIDLGARSSFDQRSAGICIAGAVAGAATNSSSPDRGALRPYEEFCHY